MLANLLITHHAQIVARARARVAQRRVPHANDEQLIHGIPLFLRQLARIVSGAESDVEALRDTAPPHGDALLHAGFAVAQVVHGYGEVCQVVAEVARELDVRAEELQILNCCLDDIIAETVAEHARHRELSAIAKGTEQMGVFAHELGNLLNAAALAFDSVRSGYVPTSGKTAAVLGRSLRRMRELLDRSLAEMRLDAHLHHPQSIRLAELVEEIEIGAAAEARARELQLVVHEVPRDISVLGDRPMLASSLANLGQNALRFTRAHSSVTLRVLTTMQRVYLDVEMDLPRYHPEGATDATDHS